MFNQRENNSDHPRSNFPHQRAADHPAQLEKKKYDREFLLSLRFSTSSMQKPEGLPSIPGVVLNRPNEPPSRFSGATWQKNHVPDFLPSYVHLNRQPTRDGWRRRTEPHNKPRNEPRRVINNVSLNKEVQLNRAANAWRPGLKKTSVHGEEKKDDAEAMKTQEMLKSFRSILNKLTPQMFDRLIKRVNELDIDTEERLKGVIDLVFEKAIGEQHFSETYARMCHCLVDLKVPTSENPAVNVDFRTLLLRCCQKEFQKNKEEEIIEGKQKQLDGATEIEERQQLKAELEEVKNKARRRSLGNIKFVGELFKLKMVAASIVHQCIAKLLKDNAEESLECLSKLLSTVGKDIDEKDKTRMDHYFTKIEEIIRAKKSSPRIRFMLQDILDLRRNKWVPRRADLGPKTIDEIHKDAELEGNDKQSKVQQQLRPKKDWTCGSIYTHPVNNITKPVPKAPSVPESAPSALELQEAIDTEAEDKLAKETTVPAEETIIPADGMSMPAEETIIPADGTTMPAEETIIPADAMSMPAEETIIPADGMSMPAEETIIPADGTTMPDNENTVPVNYKVDQTPPSAPEDLSVNRKVDQTPPSAPEDLTVTVEQETNEETVYTEDVMGAVKNELDQLDHWITVKQHGVSSAPESNTIAPDSNRIPLQPIISTGVILSGICCSGLLLYHGVRWLHRLV